MSDAVGIKCTYAGGKTIILDGSNPIHVDKFDFTEGEGPRNFIHNRWHLDKKPSCGTYDNLIREEQYPL